MLDIFKSEWVKVVPAGLEKPSGRINFPMNIVENQIWIFGGYTNGFFLNDMYNFDLNTNIWTKVNIVGETPGARSGMTGHTFGERIIYTGGCNTTINQCYNEEWMFDRRTYEFKLIYQSQFQANDKSV